MGQNSTFNVSLNTREFYKAKLAGRARDSRQCATMILAGEHVLHCDPFGLAGIGALNFAVQNA
jgi:hypothetical protein